MLPKISQSRLDRSKEFHNRSKLTSFRDVTNLSVNSSVNMKKEMKPNGVTLLFLMKDHFRWIWLKLQQVF